MARIMKYVESWFNKRYGWLLTNGNKELPFFEGEDNEIS